jgi:hypothetical protein
MLNLFGNGAVGFIYWLGLFALIRLKLNVICSGIQGSECFSVIGAKHIELNAGFADTNQIFVSLGEPNSSAKRHLKSPMAPLRVQNEKAGKLAFGFEHNLCLGWAETVRTHGREPYAVRR